MLGLRVCLVNPPELAGHLSDRDKAGGLGVARPKGLWRRTVRPLPPPPMDWLYAGAIARRAGVTPGMVDALGMALTASQTLQAVKSSGAQVVGVRLSLPSLDADLRLAQTLATGLPDARVFVFGACIQTTLADWKPGWQFDVLYGEVEALLDAYLKGLAHPAILRPTLDLSRPRCWEVLETLDDLPVPAWDLVDPVAYAPSGRRDDMVYYLSTSRGCPKACTMCPYYVHQGANWRTRSVDSVLSELTVLKAQGARLIQTRDPNIGWRKRHLLELLSALPVGMRFTWHIETDLETLDETDLQALHRAGVSRILTGVESADVQVLRDVGQNQQAFRRVLVNMETCHRLGIGVTGFFMVGAPSESWATLRHTLQVALTLPCDYRVSLMTPYQGTAMREQVVRENLLDGPQRFQDHCGYRVMARTRHLSRPELMLAWRWIRTELRAREVLRNSRARASLALLARRFVDHAQLLGLRLAVRISEQVGRGARERSPWSASAS